MSAYLPTGGGYGSNNPGYRLKVVLVVLAFHALVGYALLTGMGQPEVTPNNSPLQAILIQEVTIAPPPEPTVPEPKPPLKLPQPKSVPKALPKPLLPPVPQEAQIAVAQAPIQPAATPAPAATVKASETTAPPIAISAPAATSPLATAPLPPQPTAAPKPDIRIACPKQTAPQMPRQALRDGTQGLVRAQAVIRNGGVHEVTILSGPTVFHAAVQRAMRRYECTIAPNDILVTQDFNFKFE